VKVRSVYGVILHFQVYNLNFDILLSYISDFDKKHLIDGRWKKLQDFDNGVTHLAVVPKVLHKFLFYLFCFCELNLLTTNAKLIKIGLKCLGKQ
jgi:uncharacterized membrane protein